MEHMTAEEIFIKAKQIQPSIAVGTVYRNLGLMTEAGENKADRHAELSESL